MAQHVQRRIDTGLQRACTELLELLKQRSKLVRMVATTWGARPSWSATAVMLSLWTSKPTNRILLIGPAFRSKRNARGYPRVRETDADVALESACRNLVALEDIALGVPTRPAGATIMVDPHRSAPVRFLQLSAALRVSTRMCRP